MFDAVYENTRPGMSEEENMKRAAELLRENARELAKSLIAALDRHLRAASQGDFFAFLGSSAGFK